ncbi:MAG: Flp pilus assembly protein CpaB, partial [Bryobacteraceae bacterium]
MNKRTIGVFGFAFVVALLAALLFYKALARNFNAVQVPVTQTVQLWVAARNLDIGTLIKEPDLKLVNWSGPVPTNVILKKEDILSRGVLATIFVDEPIAENRLAPVGAGAGLAATIKPGMRAFAIHVSDTSGVAGFVVPGMHVDIIIEGLPPNAPQNIGQLSKTLLQNVEILSAGQNIQKDAEWKPITVGVVTLLLTPEQAEIITLATDMKIQLTLRNPLDHETAKTPGSATGALFSGQQYKGW